MRKKCHNLKSIDLKEKTTKITKYIMFTFHDYILQNRKKIELKERFSSF